MTRHFEKAKSLTASRSCRLANARAALGCPMPEVSRTPGVAPPGWSRAHSFDGCAVEQSSGNSRSVSQDLPDIFTPSFTASLAIL